MITLKGIDPDHLFIIWWIYHSEVVTPSNLIKGWCVYQQPPLDY